MSPSLVTTLASLVCTLTISIATADTPRQTKVEQNSEQVMPFRMDTSMHAFVPNQRGGVQTVMVPNRDPKQISLVRSHLRKEATAFASGVFSDPASIHGRAMPGLGVMHAGSAKIHMVYSNMPNGARITYSTTDPELIAAIHRWFKAQVSDHGSHALMKM